MRLAVLTAYSPNFKRVAMLCTPSQKCFAARMQSEFFEMPLPDDGLHQWRKLSLIHDWLTKWHSLLWLDADCIVNHDWKLPRYYGANKFFFPMTRNGARHFAALWINSPEAFSLLGALKEIHADDPECSVDVALDVVLREREFRSFAGRLEPGLVHYAGADIWEKQQKLRCEAMA